MTYHLTLCYPTGHHQTLTFPSAFSRALIVITASPYADVVKQWETDEEFIPRGGTMGNQQSVLPHRKEGLSV